MPAQLLLVLYLVSSRHYISTTYSIARGLISFGTPVTIGNLDRHQKVLLGGLPPATASLIKCFICSVVGFCKLRNDKLRDLEAGKLVKVKSTLIHFYIQIL